MSFLVLIRLAEVWAAPSTGVEPHAASVTQVIFPLINFLIFLYLVKRFLLPFIKDHLRSRREEILNSVKEAEEGRGHAEAMVRDYRGRLERLDEETKKIHETSLAEGEREKVKLLAEAGDLATKIKADADFLAQQEVKVAQRRLREEIAHIARAAAEKVIQRHLTAADQRRMVEEFVNEVETVKEVR